MAAIEWAMDPTAPLPGFLGRSGLASATDVSPHVPHQLSWLAQETWKDAGDMPKGAAERGDVASVSPLHASGAGPGRQSGASPTALLKADARLPC
ncbi:hypothetical protein [Streptomyces brevispora]|uniref:hypothetical protein n=1 Tax=Streptomyces brevispora TaxID=887462 RepID=UPI00380BBB6F